MLGIPDAVLEQEFSDRYIYGTNNPIAPGAYPEGVIDTKKPQQIRPGCQYDSFLTYSFPLSYADQQRYDLHPYSHNAYTYKLGESIALTDGTQVTVQEHKRAWMYQVTILKDDERLDSYHMKESDIRKQALNSSSTCRALMIIDPPARGNYQLPSTPDVIEASGKVCYLPVIYTGRLSNGRSLPPTPPVIEVYPHNAVTLYTGRPSNGVCLPDTPDVISLLGDTTFGNRLKIAVARSEVVLEEAHHGYVYGYLDNLREVSNIATKTFGILGAMSSVIDLYELCMSEVERLMKKYRHNVDVVKTLWGAGMYVKPVRFLPDYLVRPHVMEMVSRLLGDDNTPDNYLTDAELLDYFYERVRADTVSMQDYLAFARLFQRIIPSFDMIWGTLISDMDVSLTHFDTLIDHLKVKYAQERDLIKPRMPSRDVLDRLKITYVLEKETA